MSGARYRRRITLLILACLLAVPALGGAALAHGNEVTVQVTGLTPDQDRPLTRLYRAEVRYEDGDPVTDAHVSLVAVRREGGSPIGPVVFADMSGSARYAAEVDYDRFGTWDLTVRVEGPGEGSAVFAEDVVPGAATAVLDAPEAQSLSILFEFDRGDVANIIVRIGHVLGGILWLGPVAIAAFAVWFATDDETRARMLVRVRRFFLPVAGAGLALIMVSGVHSAVNGTPIRSPGILDLDTLLAIPFGEAYVAALLVMIGAWPLLAIVTWRLDHSLAAAAADGGQDSAITTRLRRGTSAAFAIVGVVAVDTTVLLYLHNISHLSLVVPE